MIITKKNNKMEKKTLKKIRKEKIKLSLFTDA